MDQLLPLAIIAAATVPLFVMDVRSHRLPNAFTYPMALVIGAALAIAGQWQAVVCGLVAGLAMLALSLVTRGGIGLGDVKLSVSLGMASGVFSTTATVLVFAYAFIIGGLWATIGLASRKYNRGSAIAFGPALLVGFWAAIMSVML